MIRYMDVPDPPTLQYLFLEQPWPVTVALLGAGFVLQVIGRRRSQRRLVVAAVIALALAGGVQILSRAVRTDREQILALTEQLVAAAGPIDMARLDELIAPQAVLRGPDGSTWMQYPQIRLALGRVVPRHGLGTHQIRAIRAAGRGQCVFELRSKSADSGMPIQSLWGITWQKDQEGHWRVIDIQWLQFQGRDPVEGIWR